MACRWWDIHPREPVGLMHEWLGYRPPDRQLGGNKNTAVMEGLRVKAKWLEDRFPNPLPVDAPDALVQ